MVAKQSGSRNSIAEQRLRHFFNKGSKSDRHVEKKEMTHTGAEDAEKRKRSEKDDLFEDREKRSVKDDRSQRSDSSDSSSRSRSSSKSSRSSRRNGWQRRHKHRTPPSSDPDDSDDEDDKYYRRACRRIIDLDEYEDPERPCNSIQCE